MLRLGDPVYAVLWKGFNLLFLVFALHHGFYGLNNVLSDYIRNDMVRVTRLMLAPGERTALHAPCGMLVGVSEGNLVFDSGGPEEHMRMTPAGFKWRQASTPVHVRNAGDAPFHGVDIVVK